MRTSLIAFTVTILAIAHAHAADLTIVQDGKSDFTIWTPVDPTAAESLAASEFASYVEQMSGAKLPIERAARGVKKPVIIFREWMHRLSPDMAEQHGASMPDTPDDFSIRVRADSVTVTGASGRGLLFGTYRLLDALGCRFLAPQYGHYRGAAEVIPRSTTLTAKEWPNLWISPKLAYRKLYIEEGISHDEANLKQLIEWMPKAGYNVLVCPLDYGNRGRVQWDKWRDALTPELQKRGITIEVGGHGYENFLNAEMDGGKVFAVHPEWFGADEKGTRRKQKSYVFCTSNADAVEFVTKNFLAYVAMRPEIQIFDFWPPDGARWCACDDCAKLGDPPERQAKLLSHVSREVAKVRPDLKMEAIAYSKLIEPPKTEKIDENVLIDFCPIAQNFEFTLDDPAGHSMREDGTTPRANKQYFDALRAWRARFDGPISIYSYYRRYAWDSLPVTLPWHMKRELTFYASIPTQGISTYSEPGDWFAYELNHYVLPALAWDRDQDVDALVNKFADARYGEASPVAMEAYRTLADVVRAYCSVPFVSLKPKSEIHAAAQRVDAVAKQLHTARASAKDDVIKRHLQRLGFVVEYVQRDLAVQEMRAARAPREQIRERIAKDHAWLSEHADEGVVLIKGHRLNLDRAYRRYGVDEKAPTTAPAE
ncbi:MAG TPA: DUF4838 domain-containing protein [Tepidisphaeraceae bacterium]|nr:DUF4838 domain-containing protein [Tepidisphaeraceae bacterium]